MAISTEAENEPHHERFHESSSRVVWALAWPAVALNSLQVINTLLDRSFIGHLPQASLTAHGAAINVMFLMFSLAMALGTAATALVSRAFGAGDISEYRLASRQSLAVTVWFGFAFTALCIAISGLAAKAILPAQAVAAFPLMTKFLVAYATGLPAIYVIQTLAGSLRGIGDTKSPMVISGFQILLHILLNYLLIFPERRVGSLVIPGANLGLTGAALSLSLSAWIAAIVYLGYSGRTPLGVLWNIRLPQKEWLTRVLRIAFPAAGMAVLRVLSLTMFTLVLGGVSNAEIAIAAMGVGFAVESIMFMPSFGLSMASGALVGQSLGMQRPDRAERLAWVAAHHAGLVTLLLSIPIYIFAPSVAGLMLGDKHAIIHEAATFIRYLCVSEVGFAYAMVMVGAMQGAGDTVRPFWISVIMMWGIRVPLAIVLALPSGFHLVGRIPLPLGFALGSVGAWAAMSVTQGLQGILSVMVFRQGGWKYKQV